MRWYYAHYLPDGPLAVDPYVSPLHAPSVVGMAAALVVTVEHDPLRDDGRHYAARLRCAGVPVRDLRYDDLAHGALGRVGHAASDRMLTDLIRALNRPLPETGNP